MKVILLHASAVIAFAVVGSAIAAGDPMVGGARMSDNKNIIENAVNSKDHTTLVAAVKAGGLADTLQGPGPLTVFAPTNAAFADLPAGTVGTLLKPENYHVVPPCRRHSRSVDQASPNRGGKAVLKTVQGEPLTVQGTGKNLMIT